MRTTAIRDPRSSTCDDRARARGPRHTLRLARRTYPAPPWRSWCVTARGREAGPPELAGDLAGGAWGCLPPPVSTGNSRLHRRQKWEVFA